MNSIRRHDAKQKNVAAKSKKTHVKTLQKNKIPGVSKGASPVARQMIEKTRAKAEGKEQQAEARDQRKNMEAESLDEGLALVQNAGQTGRRSVKILKKGVKKAVKGIRFHKRKRHEAPESLDLRGHSAQARRKQKGPEHRQAQSATPIPQAPNPKAPNTHTKMRRAKIKTVRLRQREKPPIPAASSQRVKLKKAAQRRVKVRVTQRSIRGRDGKIAVIVAATAPKAKALAKRAARKSLKNAAALTKDQLAASVKSALKYKPEAQSYESRGLDDTLSGASEGTRLFKKAAVKASKAVKEHRKHAAGKGKETLSTAKDTPLASRQPTASGRQAQKAKSNTSASLHRDKSISPRQKPTMQSAKTRSSIGRGQSQIKEKAQVIQSKQKQMPLKNRLAKRKQIKKAKLAQAQTRQKAAAAVKAAGKRALVMMKEVAAKAAAAIKSLIAALGGGSMMIVLLLLIFVIGFLAASPFGLFMSNDTKNGRPLAEVIAELDAEMRGGSAGTVSEQEGETFVSNWMEVIAVFAVRTTTDKSIALDVGVLDEKRVDLLREVLNDMNQVSTKQVTETITDEQGNQQTVTKTVSKLDYKTALQMADIYGFDNDQRALLDELLSDQYFDWFMELLGESGVSGAPLSPEELEAIINDLPPSSDALVQQVIRLAASRLGDPYSQDYRGQGRYVDCSYFVKWVFNNVGVPICDIAAYQAEWCVNNGLAISGSDLQAGDLVFWSFGSNDRYFDIDHVGIYIGGGMVIDASSSKGKVVKRNIFSSGNQVMYGRPLAYQ